MFANNVNRIMKRPALACPVACPARLMQLSLCSYRPPRAQGEVRKVHQALVIGAPQTMIQFEAGWRLREDCIDHQEGLLLGASVYSIRCYVVALTCARYVEMVALNYEAGRKGKRHHAGQGNPALSGSGRPSSTKS